MAVVFMDLQGTLGGDPIGDISSFYFYDNTIEALKVLTNHRNIIVTNQSRIARGYLTMHDFLLKVEEIKSELKESNVILKEVYCCPHIKEDACNCKKPKTGMYNQASAFRPIEGNTYIIGDMGMSDMKFGENIKAKKILVLTGAGRASLEEYKHTWSDIKADYVANDLLDAAKWINKEESTYNERK